MTNDQLADEIERNLNLTPSNERIHFDDLQWAQIVKALRRADVDGSIQKDAERYRFLRNTPPWNNKVSAIISTGVADDIAILTHEGLDIAIDQQMGRDNSPRQD